MTDHYKWIYKTVLVGEAKIRTIVDKYGFKSELLRFFFT
jgi:hypothetical protein